MELFSGTRSRTLSNDQANNKLNVMHLKRVRYKEAFWMDEYSCQSIVILDTGEMQFPYTWQPHILDVQLFRIGNFYIAAVPSEFTTMSGRRLRNAIKNKLVEYGIGDNETTVVLSGPANGYAVSNHYDAKKRSRC